MGTITAYIVYNLSGEDWRLCYFIGGGMGIALLFLRVSVLESGMYDAVKTSKEKMGNLLMLFTSRDRFLRYVRGIFIGLPVWYIIGIIITFADEFAKRFHIENFSQPKALMLQYVALGLGDLSAGLLSNYLKSRKKTLLIFYGIATAFIALFFITKGGGSAANMYIICMGLGFGSGISVQYITMSAEQFGTNLRATAAISIPNMVRGCLPLIILLFKFLRGDVFSGENSYITAAWITGITIMCIGFIAALYTKDTFGKDLNFIEQ